jgi:hypothetical protein
LLYGKRVLCQCAASSKEKKKIYRKKIFYLQYGANIFSLDNEKNSALHKAAFCARIDCGKKKKKKNCKKKKKKIQLAV